MRTGCGAAIGTKGWAIDRLQSTLGSAFDAVAGALDYAAERHDGQVRLVVPGSLTVPYLEHPVEVTVICWELWGTTGLSAPSREAIASAALLHDVVEDCAAPIDELEAKFGEEVAGLVQALSKPEPRDRESAEARMRRFSSQIVAAGPAAIFLKACDLIHNLSRTDTTPSEVITRALERGRRYYLPLIETAGLGEDLSIRVTNAIANAEAGIKRTGEAVPAEHGRIQNAILQAIRGRVELHDADRLLREIFGVGETLVVRFSSRGQQTIVCGGLPTKLDESRLTHIRKLARDAGGVVRLGTKLLRTGKADPASSPVAAFAATDATFDGGDTLVIWSLPADYGSALPPGFSAESLLLLVLAVVGKPSAQLHRDIAVEALSLGIEFDVGLVNKLRIHRGHLRSLARWRQLCDLASEVVEAEVRSFIHSQAQRGPLWHRVRIEHRTKTFPSILRKFATNNASDWPKFWTMTDIGGVRIICPTNAHLKACVQFLEDRAAHHPLCGPLRRYDLEPTEQGYRGVHAIRKVQLPGQADTVPCEVQIRTLLQDTWSTLSHTVAYKVESVEARRQRDDLRRLSERLHECEDLIIEIFGRETMHDGS